MSAATNAKSSVTAFAEVVIRPTVKAECDYTNESFVEILERVFPAPCITYSNYAEDRDSVTYHIRFTSLTAATKAKCQLAKALASQFLKEPSVYLEYQRIERID